MLSVIRSHLQQQITTKEQQKKMSLHLCVCVLKVWYSVSCAIIAVNKTPSFSGITIFLLFLCSKYVDKVVGISVLHYFI